MADEDSLVVKDSNGTRLADGDSVTLVKDLKVKGTSVTLKRGQMCRNIRTLHNFQPPATEDLKVKGTSVTLKRGTLVKNIRLTDDADEIECNVEKVKGLVLRTEFLKKA